MTARHPASAGSPTRATWLVALLTLLSLALRLYHLGVDSLWYDEAVSVFLAGQPAAELIAHTARDIHPPGYYLLLRGWLSLAGFPTGVADATGYRLEFMASFLSLFFGVLLTPLTWQLARRLRLGNPVAAIAAFFVTISPFGVWYSQEVRMYTLGAALGLVCLLAASSFLLGDVSLRRLRLIAVIYGLAAAAGMFTLYYFAFLLISLNALLIPLLIWRRRVSGSGLRRLTAWLVGQLIALVLFLPWLPTAWRQATDPPVPPWRSAPQLLTSLAESWGALSFGQSAPLSQFWPLLLLTLVLLVAGAWAAWRRGSITGEPRPSLALEPRRGDQRLALLLLLVTAFSPLALILLASLATPLYHVRYLFTYSPAFSVLLALGVVAVARWRQPSGRWLAVAALALIALGSALSLHSYWSDPVLAADDHRSAVRELAARWQPGDAILVNAGYAYPSLLTYWTGPPIAWRGRLTDYNLQSPAAAADGPVIIQTGHVDSEPGLGWDDARSDFFAISGDDARQRLLDLSASRDRLWHYRIYDTVNDPAGEVRSTLEANATLIDDRVYGGEANLRVQLWQGMRATLSSYMPAAVATFDGWLTLAMPDDALQAQLAAGQMVSLPELRWLRPPEQTGQPVAISLRLVDASGEVWAASDEALGGNVLDMTTSNELLQPLLLPVPAGTAPGRYDLVLVVYDPADGQPLPVVPAQGSGDPQQTSINLGSIDVLTGVAPASAGQLADFALVQLLQADSPASVVSPGDQIPVELLWQAGPEAAAEPLVVVVQLVGRDGTVAASLEEQPLSGRFPTTAWDDDMAVRDRHRLSVPAGIAPGTYRLIVGVYRASDGQRLRTKSVLPGLGSKDHVVVREIEVK